MSVIDICLNPQIRRYDDVKSVSPGDVVKLAEFFCNEKRVVRMEESCKWHLRPAIAGVILELEQKDCYQNLQAKVKPARLNQLVGLMVNIVMVKRGWTPVKIMSVGVTKTRLKGKIYTKG